MKYGLILFFRGSVFQTCDFSARWHNCRKGLLASSCPSVSLSFRPLGRIRLQSKGFSLSLIYEEFFENLSRKFKFNKILKKINDNLPADRSTFTSASVPLQA